MTGDVRVGLRGVPVGGAAAGRPALPSAQRPGGKVRRALQLGQAALDLADLHAPSLLGMLPYGTGISYYAFI